MKEKYEKRNVREKYGERKSEKNMGNAKVREKYEKRKREREIWKTET